MEGGLSERQVKRTRGKIEERWGGGGGGETVEAG